MNSNLTSFGSVVFCMKYAENALKKEAIAKIVRVFYFQLPNVIKNVKNTAFNRVVSAYIFNKIFNLLL